LSPETQVRTSAITSAHSAIVSSSGARRSEPAEAGRDRLSPRFSRPRSRASSTTPRSRGREPKARDEQLARDDRRHDPAREHSPPDEDDDHRQDEQLVGHRVEQRAERGLRPLRLASRPSNQSVAIASAKSAVAQ
jgi:hypothetical protein